MDEAYALRTRSTAELESMHLAKLRTSRMGAAGQEPIILNVSTVKLLSTPLDKRRIIVKEMTTFNKCAYHWSNSSAFALPRHELVASAGTNSTSMLLFIIIKISRRVLCHSIYRFSQGFIFMYVWPLSTNHACVKSAVASKSRLPLSASTMGDSAQRRLTEAVERLQSNLSRSHFRCPLPNPCYANSHMLFFCGVTGRWWSRFTLAA